MHRNTGQRNQIKEMYSLKIRIHQFEAVLTQQENCWRLNRLESWPCCGWGRGAPRCRAGRARTGWRWWSLPPPACWRSTARPSSRWGPAAWCPRRSPAESLANIIFSPIEYCVAQKSPSIYLAIVTCRVWSSEVRVRIRCGDHGVEGVTRGIYRLLVVVGHHHARGATVPATSVVM